MPARDISERAVRLREGVRRDHCVCCVRAAGGQINLIFLAYEVPAFLSRPFLRRLNKSPAQLIEMDQRRGNPFQCFIGLAVSYVLLSDPQLRNCLRHAH